MNLFDTPQQPQDQDQQQPWQQLTPQQKLALALMQQGNQQQVNQRGQYSPLQGMSQLANGALSGYLMGQQMRQPAAVQPTTLPTGDFARMDRVLQTPVFPG